MTITEILKESSEIERAQQRRCLTEILLEDVSMVWVPWGPYDGRAVDCAYNSEGRLVGIRIWDDVRFRKPRR